MPVATAQKVEALSKDFHSQRRLAEILDVNPAQVSRWIRGQGIDPENAKKVQLLELVTARLAEVYHPAVIQDWLLGFNAHLGNRRPVDMIRMGRISEVLGAIDAAAAGSFA
jgi:hypothetical protein